MQRAVALPLRREAFVGRSISSCRWGRSQQFYSVLLACGKVFCLAPPERRPAQAAAPNTYCCRRNSSWTALQQAAMAV